MLLHLIFLGFFWSWKLVRKLELINLSLNLLNFPSVLSESKSDTYSMEPWIASWTVLSYACKLMDIRLSEEKNRMTRCRAKKVS